uniref:Alkaline ceramidase n=1 Tax=Panagrolaimus sp. JU765 TaxID=591449 RepID=A0AC34RP73_9BILA
MSPWFEYESGHAWCESAYKYQTMTFVAEFANTLTNLPIIVLPLLNILILWKYIQEVNWMIILPHLLLTFNGFASAYYHATLNLFGQLVDELSLVWLINTCLVVYMPVMRWYPQHLKQHLDRIRWTIVGFTVLISGLCFIRPNLNALALMSYSVPSIFVIYYEGSNTGIPATLTTTWRIFVLWAIASTCWFSDRLLCDVWLYLGVPYLHAIFHLISSVAGYHVFVMFSLVDIKRRDTEHKFNPVIRHFPIDKATWYTVPYITLVDKDVVHVE